MNITYIDGIADEVKQTLESCKIFTNQNDLGVKQLNADGGMSLIINCASHWSINTTITSYNNFRVCTL